MNIFMFNHSGSMNRGCEAIVRGTVKIVENACKGGEYMLSSYAPKEDRALMDLVKVVAFKPEPLSRAEHIKAALSIKIKKDERYSVIKSYTRFFEDAASADICLSVGGDTYCYGDNSIIRILTAELKRKGKKNVLWGASIGDEDLTADKEKNLSSFDAIFARETLTYNLIKEKNINPNTFLFPDPAFTLLGDELPLPGGWQENNTLGINISPIVAEKNPKLLRIITDFLKRVIKETDMSIALIPHVTSTANNDYVLLESLFNENNGEAQGRLIILPADLNAAQYKGYIARLSFLIGARTHATIAAYTSCVPAIVLGYSAKSRGIALDIFGDERFVLDAGKLQSGNELYDVFESLREQKTEIANIYDKVIPCMIQKAYTAGSKLAEI